jgi:transaldolase
VRSVPASGAATGDGGALRRLIAAGQSPWLDFIQRRLVRSGELERMIEEWGLRGITSNPAIFENAIAGSHDYDDDIRRLAAAGMDPEQIYERLALEDVRAAASLFGAVYERTEGIDGFVSLEVSPHLADDTAQTVLAARRLWAALERSNVMIKVPGTAAGLAAIRTLLAEGINVNVTLLFSVRRYREVLAAHLDGLEAALAAGRSIDRIASVASFFLSRIDTLLDRELDRVAAAGGADARVAASLRGGVAVASARSAYAVLAECLSSERFRRLAARGAHVQRLLWASTSTKDPAYGDLKYVEPLIGPHTVNTMPLATLEAYRDHGHPAPRIDQHAEEAAQLLHRLVELEIDLEAATNRLLEEGIRKFADQYDALLRALEVARRATRSTV